MRNETVRSTARNFITATLAVCLAAPQLLAQQAPKRNSAPAQQWRVQGTKTRLRIESGRLIQFSNIETVEAIPLDQIARIEHDTASHHPVAHAMGNVAVGSFEAASGAGQGGGGIVIFGLMTSAAMAPFSPIKTKRHIIRVAWREAAGDSWPIEHLSEFRLSGSDAAALLARLQTATGIQARDIAAERRQQAQHEKEKANAEKESQRQRRSG